VNIINLAAFPIMLGVVTDYVVHCYERYRSPGLSHEMAYQQSFRPILGSTVTTIIGFASLLFADMGGLRSMGLTSALGILLGSVVTLFWYPSFLFFNFQSEPNRADQVSTVRPQA